MTLVKELEQHQAQRSSQARGSGESAKRGLLESFDRMDREHQERLRKLGEIKENLPKDKEKLNFEELSRGIAGLASDSKTIRSTEFYELQYYLDHPEIKNTKEFIRFIKDTWGKEIY